MNVISFRGWLLLVALAAASTAPGQGSFRNLDFESPNEANLTNSFAAFSDAFPGWVGYVGTDQVSVAGYNFISGGSALVTLITSNAPNFAGASVINGNFTATLASGQHTPEPIVFPTSIGQTGVIPQNTRSLRFSASASVDYLAVTFNGAKIPFSVIGNGANYKLYAGDLTPFAGLSGELRFTEQAAIFEPYIVLDDVQFSEVAIPEPTTPAIWLFAGLALGGQFTARGCLGRFRAKTILGEVSTGAH